MNHARLAVLVLAAAGVTGCRSEAEPAPKAARSWNCASVAVPGGESLACTSSALTADGPATADPESCEGAQDNPELCPPGSTAPGSTTDGTLGETSTWTDYTIEYRCRAGNLDCPPAGATPGTNTGGTTDSTTSDGTTGGAGGSDPSGGTTDGTSGEGTGGGGGAGGGDGDGEKADKDDAKGEDAKGGTKDGTSSSTGASGGSSGGGGGASSAEEYDCRGKGDKRECVKVPGAGSTTDGTSSDSPSGGSGSGGGATSGGEPGLTGGSSAGTTTSNGKSATFDGSKDNGDGTSTWCWSVDEVSGQDLSNWVIGTGSCKVVSRSPSNGSENVSPDPNSGLVGVKWNTGGGFSSGQFCIAIQGTPSAGTIKFSMKAPGVAYGMTQGPVCQ